MSIFARVFQGSSDGVQAQLKRVTESNILEVPEDLLAPILEAARGEDERREVMRHLQNCLAEPCTRKWRRIHAGIVLAESLVLKGPPELLYETSQGYHFDLVQRLSLLERWEYSTDKRVQNSIRTKAKALRAEVVPKLQEAEDNCDSLKDSISTGTPGTLEGICGTATAHPGQQGKGPVGFGHLDLLPSPAAKPQGQMVLNGIVTVGHNDDTTSDSSDAEEDGRRRAVQYRRKADDGRRGAQPRQRQAGRPRRAATSRDATAESEGSGEDDAVKPAPSKEQHSVSTPTQKEPVQHVSVDLLDL